MLEYPIVFGGTRQLNLSGKNPSDADNQQGSPLYNSVTPQRLHAELFGILTEQ